MKRYSGHGPRKRLVRGASGQAVSQATKQAVRGAMKQPVYENAGQSAGGATGQPVGGATRQLPRCALRRRAGKEHPLSRIIHRIGADCRAQATVEYLVVALGLFALIATLTVFGGRVQEGLFIQHAADSASHAMTKNAAGSIGDVLLY